jgi:hypothetical protein
MGSSPARSQRLHRGRFQAQHLDLEFYDHYFQPGAYLWTRAECMGEWHPELAS